jgi:hypothetical protein
MMNIILISIQNIHTYMSLEIPGAIWSYGHVIDILLSRDSLPKQLSQHEIGWNQVHQWLFWYLQPHSLRSLRSFECIL